MSIHPLAGQPIRSENLIDVDRIIGDYSDLEPDYSEPDQRVSFGTSGHRGRSAQRSFNERHIRAITQAVCDIRIMNGIDGPVFVGMDTHALSDPAFRTAVGVLAANGCTVLCEENMGFTPTPVISRAILTYNLNRTGGLADGLILTPSHNPPEDGGIKYNSANGGPAGTELTTPIENRANELLCNGEKVSCIPFERAYRSSAVRQIDLAADYIADLDGVLELERVSKDGIRIGADPMGGAGIRYWNRIAEAYGLDLTVVNGAVDPTFSFMRIDHDGKTRMDCSSPYAMAGLLELGSSFDIAFGNDPDFDRHGIVTRSHGLLNPNHYLSAAIHYLFSHRTLWSSATGIGKTVVSSSMIDRVALALNRNLVEVPVGFKWFVDGLNSGILGFGGEESAGASFLRKNGRVWSTDKDGIIMNLLAAEMMAVTGKDPGELYTDLTREHGRPVYRRMDVGATPAEKKRLRSLGTSDVTTSRVAGEPVLEKITSAPGNGELIGGLKVVTENGWFAARPSGTEDIYKVYAESFLGEEHLSSLQDEAVSVVKAAIA